MLVASTCGNLGSMQTWLMMYLSGPAPVHDGLLLMSRHRPWQGLLELSLQAQTEIPRSALRAVMALRATHPRWSVHMYCGSALFFLEIQSVAKVNIFGIRVANPHLIIRAPGIVKSSG